MKKKKALMAALLVFSVMSLVLPITVFSEEKSSVTVRAILPKNQNNKDVMHYDLKMKPKQEQDIELELTNSSEKDKEIKLELTNAKTDNFGLVAYENTDSKNERNETLKLALTDIASVPDKVVVRGKSKEVVKIKIKTPNDEFEGVVAGAVRSTEILGKADETDKSDKNNSVVYTVALNITESDKEVQGELELLDVFPSQTDGKNVIKGKIQNKEAQFIDEINYDVKITKKDNSEVIYKTNVENYRMAPNSSFELETSLNKQKFLAGEYTYKVAAESKRTGQKWDLVKEFSIDSKEAKTFNKTAIGLEDDKEIYLYVIGVGGLLLFVALVVSLVNAKKKKKKKRKKGKSKKKRETTSSKKKRSKKKSHKKKSKKIK